MRIVEQYIREGAPDQVRCAALCSRSTFYQPKLPGLKRTARRMMIFVVGDPLSVLERKTFYLVVGTVVLVQACHRHCKKGRVYHVLQTMLPSESLLTIDPFIFLSGLNGILLHEAGEGSILFFR